MRNAFHDGVGDVAFGLRPYGASYGRVWVFGSSDPGSFTGTDYSSNGDLTASIDGDTDYDQGTFGYAFNRSPIDLNQDGLSDFVVGDPEHKTNGLTTDAGAVFISYQIE